MSDNREGEEGYDWLYSPGTPRGDRREPPDRPERPEPPEEAPEAPPSAPPLDHEGTQALPVVDDGSADAEADASADASAADEAEATRAIATDQPPAQGPEHTQVIGSPDGEPSPNPSFGGVYAAPAPGARYTDRPLTSPPGPTPPPPPATPTAPTKTTAPPPGGRRKRRNWWLRGALILIVAWLIYLIVVPIWSWQHITKVDAEPDGDRPGDTPGTTYLLVGSDSRDDLTKEERQDLGTGAGAGQRTDTIILLHVPAGDGPRLLLSIPRDSYVNIPGHGMNKINAAYAIGGPQLLVKTIEQRTDIRIDDYIEVGFAGFVDIVDAVGGITVCPETSIDDPKAGGLKMKAGCQEVDGHTALDYSRSRAFPLGDITRAEHQREVITAVGKKAASWQTVVLPWRYWKVNHAAAQSLSVGDNVGPIDLTRFAWAMAHTGGSDSKRCVVPYTSLGTPTSVGSVVTWDKKAANTIFAAIREDDTASIHCSAQGQ